MSSTKLWITKKTYSPRNCSVVSTATLEKSSSIALRRLNYLFFNFSKQWSVSTSWILCQLTGKRLKGVHFGCYQLRKGGSLIFTVNAWILFWWLLQYAVGFLYFKSRCIQLNSPCRWITCLSWLIVSSFLKYLITYCYANEMFWGALLFIHSFNI